ncbi:MAG: mechanosensitive ion channel protein [Deltaproteobacteria bacterium HGW-Deltaproteobacteria-4]|nr:MAG: mechanosensitive ion channel protein [Deltaproteobacteria bacterium HGW-Deltaproteobacteria-4]
MRVLVSIFVAGIMSVSVCAAAPPDKTPAQTIIAPVPPPAPQVASEVVLLDEKPVLTISSGVLSFTPAERARAISERLARLISSPLLTAEMIMVANNEVTSDIVVKDLVLMAVTEADAQTQGKSRQELAQEYVEKIRSAVIEYRSERSLRQLFIDAVQAVALTLLLVVLLLLLKRYLPHVEALITSWKGTRIRSIQFQSIEVLNADRIVAMLLSFLRFMRVMLVIGLLYLYIPLVLSFFPMTEGVAARLFGYIETPVVRIGQAVLAYLPNIFFVAVICVCTYYVIRFSRFLFNEVEKQHISLPGFYSDWAMPSFKIVRFLIIAFAVVVAFPYLPGSDSPAFKGVSVFLGVLFSLGSTSAVANVVAGTILTYMRAFTLGDRVKIADTMGDVIEKTLLVTRIRTAKNVDITIPNAMVLGSHIVNYSSSARLILHTTITIGYDAPWRQVHELLLAAAASTERILPDPRPFVLQTALNDFYVSYELNATTDAPSAMPVIYSELHKNIQDHFNEAGVEIMSPHYSALRDGNTITIPANYLAAEYQPATHRINITGDAGCSSISSSGGNK